MSIVIRVDLASLLEDTTTTTLHHSVRPLAR